MKVKMGKKVPFHLYFTLNNNFYVYFSWIREPDIFPWSPKIIIDNLITRP